MELILAVSFVLWSIGFAFGVDAKLRLNAIEEKLSKMNQSNGSQKE